MLSVFTQRQLDTLHMYADRVECVFRELLNRLFNVIEFGNLDIPPYEVGPVDQKTQNLIETLRIKLENLKPNATL